MAAAFEASELHGAANVAVAAYAKSKASLWSLMPISLPGKSASRHEPAGGLAQDREPAGSFRKKSPA